MKPANVYQVFIYWFYKLHKNPSKCTFVIAFPIRSLESLSKSIASVLKYMFKQIKNYNNKYRFFQELILSGTFLTKDA